MFGNAASALRALKEELDEANLRIGIIEKTKGGANTNNIQISKSTRHNSTQKSKVINGVVSIGSSDKVIYFVNLHLNYDIPPDNEKIARILHL